MGRRWGGDAATCGLSSLPPFYTLLSISFMRKLREHLNNMSRLAPGAGRYVAGWSCWRVRIQTIPQEAHFSLQQRFVSGVCIWDACNTSSPAGGRPSPFASGKEQTRDSPALTPPGCGCVGCGEAEGLGETVEPGLLHCSHQGLLLSDK